MILRRGQDPAAIHARVFETRDAFKAHKLPSRGIGATLAALLLALHHKAGPVPQQHIERLARIYRGWRREHRWLTSSSDLPAAALHAARDVPVEVLAAAVERAYTRLSDAGFRRGNQLQLVSRVAPSRPSARRQAAAGEGGGVHAGRGHRVGRRRRGCGRTQRRRPGGAAVMLEASDQVTRQAFAWPNTSSHYSVNRTSSWSFPRATRWKPRETCGRDSFEQGDGMSHSTKMTIGRRRFSCSVGAGVIRIAHDAGTMASFDSPGPLVVPGQHVAQTTQRGCPLGERRRAPAQPAVTRCSRRRSRRGWRAPARCG